MLILQQVQRDRCYSHYIEFEINTYGTEARCIQDLKLDLGRTRGLSSDDHVRVMCCCDGIVLSHTQRRGYLVCNPITGSYRVHVSFGMGYISTNLNSCRHKKYILAGLVYLYCVEALGVIYIITHTLGKVDQGEQSSAAAASTDPWKFGFNMDLFCSRLLLMARLIGYVEGKMAEESIYCRIITAVLASCHGWIPLFDLGACSLSWGSKREYMGHERLGLDDMHGLKRM
ncbi:hypothetical protein Droror1_Dr00010074 [Drosera rotundifolia]